MPRHYCSHVEIIAHAHGRWHLRAPGQREPGSKQIMAILNNMLRLGVQPDPDCTVWVPVTRWLSAICQPQFDGTWLCVTYKFHRARQRFNREERAL
jgi:hypothetical protein